MVCLTIDGKIIYAEEGTTILEAARQHNIHIPTLCYHPRLKPLGYCRMCVVEVEGFDKPVTSCNTPVLQSLSVKTNTPRIKEMRRQILELLLGTHPVDKCLVCEKSSDCDLQECAYSLGVNKGVELQLPSLPVEGSDNPYFIREEEKCILCGRCIRVCQEVQGRFVFDLVGCGLETRVAPFNGGEIVSLKEAGCVFCGQCVDACPVGALTEKERVKKGREWEFTTVTTVCPHCALGCMVDLYIKDGQIVKARGSEQSVPANGWICRKGKFEFEKVAAGKRLTSPLIRDHRQGEDNYREVSWDEAINFIKEKLSKIIHESGAESLGVIGSPWATNEESFLLQKLAREIWKTPHIDLSVSHEYPLSIRAVRDSLPKFKGFISDLGAADCIVAIGADLSEDYPVAAQEIKNAVRYRGAKLFLLACDDPDLASMAALNLRPKPGSEPIFFRGLLRAILEENPALKNQAQAIVEDFSEYSAEYVYDKIGVNAEELLTFVRIYNHAKRVTALFDEGFLCHENSEYILDVFLELVSLSGQFSSKGTGIISLQKFPNLQGALSMGVNPYYLPGYKKAEKQGFSCREMLNQAATGKIRGLYIMGEVRKDMLHQLRKVEFLVVQGLSLSETAKYADVILPGAAIAEKAGTFTAADGRVQPLQQAINPPQGVWDDCRIIKAVATAFNDS